MTTIIASKNILIYPAYSVAIALILVSYFVALPYSEDHESPLYKSLRSNYFADATLISVGISSQILLHLLLETLASIRSLKLHMATRWSGNLAYAFNSVIIWITLRNDAITGRIYFTLQFIMMSVFVFGHVGALNVIDPDIWTRWKSFSIATLVSMYYVFTFHDQHALRLNSIYGVLAFSSYVAAAFLLTQTCLTWYRKYLYKRKFSELEQKEKINFARMCSLSIAFLGVACILAYYRDTNLDDFGATYVTTFSYVLSANTVLYSVAYARKMHIEAAEVSVSGTVCARYD